MKNFTQAELNQFSSLSGDRNPVHLHEETGRFSPWGRVVVHGVAQLLWCLEEWATSKPDKILLESIKVSFSKGLGLDEGVSLLVQGDDGTTARLVLKDKMGSVVLNLRIAYRRQEQLADSAAALPGSVSDHNVVLEPEMFHPPPPHEEEKLYLSFSPELMQLSYPQLHQKFCPQQIAALLSSTKYVGNVWPGLHSIFQGLDLRFHGVHGTDQFLGYRVVNVNEKLSLTKVELGNDFVSGTLNAFFRPAKVEQISAREVSPLIRKGEFGGQRALVIGGSRGIGEVVSKALAIGGAETTSTYYKCHNSANRIVEELKTENVSLELLQLDVENLNPKILEEIKALQATHIYYFPTPFIFQGESGKFSAELFSEFNRVYIEAFFTIFEATRTSAQAYLNPSSVALEEHSAQMLEYSMSKSALEFMSEFLMAQFPGIQIHTPRLKRMKTDQTNSLIKVAEEPIETEMIALLRNIARA